MKKRESWFREGGAETVIFVPNTPGSELKKMYEEEVGKSQKKVKVVDSAGRGPSKACCRSLIRPKRATVNPHRRTSAQCVCKEMEHAEKKVSHTK